MRMLIALADSRVADRRRPRQVQDRDRPCHADGRRRVRVHGRQHVLYRPTLVQNRFLHCI